MYQSNRSFNILPPPHPPSGHLNFWKIFCSNPLQIRNTACVGLWFLTNPPRIRNFFSLNSSGQCKTQTADCRLQTGDKMRTEGKMQTADCRPGLKCRLMVLRIEIYIKSVRTRFVHVEFLASLLSKLGSTRSETTKILKRTSYLFH